MLAHAEICGHPLPLLDQGVDDRGYPCHALALPGRPATRGGEIIPAHAKRLPSTVVVDGTPVLLTRHGNAMVYAGRSSLAKLGDRALRVKVSWVGDSWRALVTARGIIRDPQWRQDVALDRAMQRLRWHVEEQ